MFVVPGVTRGLGTRAELFDRTEPNPISLSQGSVDSTSFGNAQFRPVDHEGNIGRIGVAVTNEPLSSVSLVDDRFENPAGRGRVTELRHEIHSDSRATPTLC